MANDLYGPAKDRFLGIDFFIGLPRNQLYRVARLTKPTLWDYIIRLDDWEFVRFMLNLLTRHGSPLFHKTMTNPEWMHMLSHVVRCRMRMVGLTEAPEHFRRVLSF